MSEEFLEIVKEMAKGLPEYFELVNKLRKPIQTRLQAVLDKFAGTDFGSLQNKQMVNKNLQQMLVELELRVQCPKCGQPANLRCGMAGNAKTGSFQFQHYVRGRQTYHGGSTRFPALKLIAAKHSSF